LSGAFQKTGLGGGGDGAREGQGWAWDRDDRIGAPLEQRAVGAGVPAGAGRGARGVSARISSLTQGPLDGHRAAPERSLDQRMDALSRANEVRRLRAQLKRDLKARRVSIGALLLDPPAYLEAAKVFDLVLAVPQVGSVKATKILDSCRVSPRKTFGGLSERQRAELAARLDLS
jgi:hypothetical protein